MSILLLESFDGGTDDWKLRQRVASNHSTKAEGRTGANCLALGTQNGGYYRYSLAAAEETDTMAVAFALKKTAGAWTAVRGFRFMSDARTTVHTSINFGNDGRLEVYRGTSGAVSSRLFQSEAGAINEDGTTYTHIEVEVKLHDTTGTLRVWINGAKVADLTGLDTKNGGTKTTFDTFDIDSDAGDPNMDIDDLVIANAAGPIGDVAVYTLLPNGNGNSSDLVGSDADSIDNYQLVDESDPDDADYVGSATVDDHDGYTFGDLPVTVGTIKAVEARAYAWKTDSGTKGVRLHHRENSVDSYGDDHTLSTSPETYEQIWEENPARTAAWSITQINQSEFGAAVRAGT